jgi:hypothetical protein
MERDNYYVVKHWMIKDLGLKGINLSVFALIHGFTRDGRTKFAGSAKYISEFLGISERSVFNAIGSLIENDLIWKETGLSKDGNVDNEYYSLVKYSFEEKKIVFMRKPPIAEIAEAPYEKIAEPPYEKISYPPIYIYNNKYNLKGETDEKPKTELKEKEFITRYNEERKKLKPNGRGLQLDNKAKRQLNAALKNGYTVEDLITVFKNAAEQKNHVESGYKYLTPEFITRQDKINLYIDTEDIKKELDINGDY